MVILIARLHSTLSYSFVWGWKNKVDDAWNESQESLRVDRVQFALSLKLLRSSKYTWEKPEKRYDILKWCRCCAGVGSLQVRPCMLLVWQPTSKLSSRQAAGLIKQAPRPVTGLLTLTLSQISNSTHRSFSHNFGRVPWCVMRWPKLDNLPSPFRFLCVKTAVICSDILSWKCLKFLKELSQREARLTEQCCPI